MHTVPGPLAVAVALVDVGFAKRVQFDGIKRELRRRFRSWACLIKLFACERSPPPAKSSRGIGKTEACEMLVGTGKKRDLGDDTVDCDAHHIVTAVIGPQQ